MAGWFSEHWFDLLQTVGIIGSLLVAAYTIHKDGQARRIGNSILINEQYGQIWREFHQHPELARVLTENAAVQKKPVSMGEELFVKLLVAHVSTVFRAWKHGEFVKLEGLRKDVRSFFGLPIPKIVWEKWKLFQDADFVRFVEDCVREI